VYEVEMTTPNKRVVVAMSGGVDSSVSAALLVEQGYEVIGMMMKLWAEDTFDSSCSTHNRCCTPEQLDDARRIADKLGIPFYVLDTKDVFRAYIVEYFLDMHRKALTPNPCIECNRHIRFTWLYENARALDADYLATGHYARITQSPDGAYQLRKGLDDAKDQSYVLSVLTQEHLAHTLFPIGNYPKPQVRDIAARFGLPTASKADSQDLCFLGDGDYRRFLREYAPEALTTGPIVLVDGTVVGEHSGLANYTVGQRKGLNVQSAIPLFVLDSDPTRNALIVGPREQLGSDDLTAHRVSWIDGSAPTEPIRAQVKIRYKAAPAEAWVTPLSADRVHIQFETPLRDITPGQGAVMYDGDRVLGAGIIERQTQRERATQSSLVGTASPA
jgi:tRNA-specific 2-thiouridylase